MIVVKDEAYDIGTNDLEIFQKPVPARFVDDTKARALKHDLEDEEENGALFPRKKAANEISELVPEFASDVIMNSVVLESWEENIQWEETEKKPQPQNSSATLVRK